MNILDAMQDPKLFAPVFKRGLFRGDSWKSWRAFLASLFALPMDDEQRALYEKHTGRTDLPASPPREACCVVGRRGGKSQVAAAIASFLAAFKTYDLAPGEEGVIMLVGADRRQARVLLSYVNAFFEIPLLAALVKTRLKESIVLNITLAVARFGKRTGRISARPMHPCWFGRRRVAR